MLFGFNKREKILVAGVELFTAHGFESTTLVEIQARAGIALNTFYKYFRDKEQLANEIYRGMHRSLEEGLEEATGDEQLSPRAQFHELWFRMADYHRQYPKVIAFLANRRHAYLDQENRLLERVPRPIAVLMERLRRQGIAKDVPVTVLAAVVWGAFVELINLRSSEPLPASDEELKAAEDCIWDAVRAKRPDDSQPSQLVTRLP